MIKCILIDNESKSVHRLALELANFNDKITVVGKFRCVDTAAEFLAKTKVHLAFINVEMEQRSAVNLIERFQAVHFQPLFSTPHSQYAINAIERSTVDFLLKPIDSVELRDCISRYVRGFEKLKNRITAKTSLENSAEENNSTKKIKIYAEGKIFFFEPTEIIYCQAAGSYTHIFLTDNRKILVTQRLKSVGNWLPENCFIRVHHSYIVNMTKVSEFDLSKNNLLLADEIVIPVSRLKKKMVLEKLS